MRTSNRRYVFLDFEHLKTIKFKKLEKVCDRIYVFVDAAEESVPFRLVQQMQRLGNSVKWMVLNDLEDGRVELPMAFEIGRLHQKTDAEIEFAILSNDAVFDPLVQYINDAGRSSVRVKSKRAERLRDAGRTAYEPAADSTTPETQDTAPDEEFDYHGDPFSFGSNGHRDSDHGDVAVIDRTAVDTVRRLMRSGNRPAELDLLRDYIRVNNEDLTEPQAVDQVIQHLEEGKEIEVHQQSVVYHF